METVVFVFQIMMWVVCPLIIGLVLLQGAAGDISSAFGGGGMLDSTLGVGAHRKMAKVTGILAGVFFVMVLVLAYTGKTSLGGVKGVALPPVIPNAAEKPAADKPAIKAPPVQIPPGTTTGASVPLRTDDVAKEGAVQPAPSNTSAAVTPAPTSTPTVVTEAPTVLPPAKAEEPAPPMQKTVEPATPQPAPETHPDTSQQSATAAPVVPPVAPAPK